MNHIPCLLDNGTKDYLKNIAEKISDNAVIVEIGSFLGGSINYLINHISKDKSVSVYCVDDWKFENISHGHMALCKPKEEKPYIAQFWDNVPECETRITTLQMDSILASKNFADKSIDFLFIDGCHTYPYVKNELLAWLPKIKDNAIILGHDYSSSHDIQKMVCEIFNNNVNFTENKDSYIYIHGKGL